jgi:hypothetical protein
MKEMRRKSKKEEARKRRWERKKDDIKTGERVWEKEIGDR